MYFRNIFKIKFRGLLVCDSSKHDFRALYVKYKYKFKNIKKFQFT